MTSFIKTIVFYPLKLTNETSPTSQKKIVALYVQLHAINADLSSGQTSAELPE